MYVPHEIIVARQVVNNPVTRSILAQCPGVPVRVVDSSRPNDIRNASALLSAVNGMAETLAVAKGVLVIVPTTDVIKPFDMPDPRIGCPHFMKLVMASNGCPYACSWCYLRQTFRGLYPFMVVRVNYDEIKRRIRQYVCREQSGAILNMGELQDSLALEHLTGAARTLIPFFGQLANGYLFMLTKSDNVEPILGQPHNGHTFVAWSLNASEISQKFEVGAPSFERRLEAAARVQKSGYPLRIRLDPIVPVPGWERMYADAVRRIFARVEPERITLGTLRFEEEFHRNRRAIVGQRPSALRLLEEMDKMVPMLPPMPVPTGGRDKEGKPRMKMSVGKYSYAEGQRIELFRTVIGEIRRHFSGPVALCKELPSVWCAVGLDPRQCRCVCQYDAADIVRSSEKAQIGGAKIHSES